MKGDFTRFSWDQSRHYRAVALQQGRVSVDADWNEQIAIGTHRIETETRDVVGACGGPLDAAGFHIVAAATDLSADEQARPENQDPPALSGTADFYVSGGRYYVGGRLIENEQIVPFSAQPYLPSAVPDTAGIYIAYLDVWDRHRTALEDPSIREVALGGPDTATRIQALWQLRLVQAGNPGDPITCLSASTAYDDATAAPTGRMTARAEPGTASSDPCIVPPGAGYRRLENQLYRVEVHGSGPRATATFKWSRDNGSVVARWESQSGVDITVSTTGPDEVLSFAPGMWVELIDEERELIGAPGTLVRIAAVNDRVLTLDPATADGPTDLPSFASVPRVRRWDSAGTVQPNGAAWIDLEGGVQIRFLAGTYRTGDHWIIPARTATAEIEWPRDGATPLPQLPFGIEHRYCRVAVMHFDGSAWTAIQDCRSLFPPLTELTELQYVSGDGQEALPEAQLDLPLVVGVANGEHPVAGARVRFTRVGADGALVAGSDVEEAGSPAQRIVLTGEDGLAEVNWQLGTPTTPVTAVVVAELIDVADEPVHLPVHFHARLSLASQVWYDGTGCLALSEADTVQEAIATLSAQAHLVRYGGEGQNTTPGGVVPRPLEVVVVSPCGPVEGATVTFTPQAQGVVAVTAADLPGASPGPLSVTTDASGFARVAWRLDPTVTEPCQQLAVVLTEAGSRQLHQPTEILFSACVGAGGRCHQFLDDLRSDGVVRRPFDAPLGLEVSISADRREAIDYSAGIAYVGGCEFEIEAGSLRLDPETLPNQVIVNDEGEVVLADADTSGSFARLADVYFFNGEILRIVDRRLDLTHLDDRVRALEEHVAAKRRDRRRFIPLLAFTLPNAGYRDGRSHTVPMPGPLGMAFDGEDIWVASQGTAVARISRDARPGESPEFIDVGAPTHMVAYDGDTHVWFTSPAAERNNQLFAIDRRTRVIRAVTVGDGPIGIAFDGQRMWVPCFLSRTISVVDVERFEVVRTLTLPPAPTGAPTLPMSVAFDGEFAWFGTSSPVLYRIGLDTEPVPVPIDGILLGRALAFDGASMWFAQGVGQTGPVGQIDVVTGQSRQFDFQASNLVCDGSRMWLIAARSVVSSDLEVFDCTTGGRIGSGPPMLGQVLASVFDGSHVWLSVVGREQGFVRRILTG